MTPRDDRVRALDEFADHRRVRVGGYAECNGVATDSGLEVVPEDAHLAPVRLEDDQSLEYDFYEFDVECAL